MHADEVVQPCWYSALGMSILHTHGDLTNTTHCCKTMTILHIATSVAHGGLICHANKLAKQNSDRPAILGRP